MIYKFVEIIVISNFVVVDILFRRFQYFRIFVAYRNKTCVVGSFAISNHTRAAIAAHNAYSYFLFHFNTFLIEFYAYIIPPLFMPSNGIFPLKYGIKLVFN